MGRYSEGELRDIIICLGRFVRCLVVFTFAKYIGAMLGADCQAESWKLPMAKYIERSHAVQRLGLGLDKSISHYNMLSVSVLSFSAR